MLARYRDPTQGMAIEYNGSQFLVHLDPVWRDRANFIINAPLEEEGYYEQLWTRQVDPSHFELCCIPFFAYDLALGDVVETASRSGREYVVTNVARPSGRYVFRVWFGGVTDPPREEVAGRLVAVGALLEWQSEKTCNLLAVDAEHLPHAQQVASLLAEYQQSRHLAYETGRTSHRC